MTNTAEKQNEPRGLKKIVAVKQLTSPVWEIVRPFTKWYFDLLKNLMVVAALIYFGERTGNETLKVVGAFSALVITVYFSSYILMWQPNFFNWKKGIFLRLVEAALSIGIVLLLFYKSQWLVGEVIKELTAAQAIK